MQWENYFSGVPPMKTTQLLTYGLALAGAFTAARANGQSLPATLIEINPRLGITATVDNGSFIQEYASGVMQFTDFEAFCIEPTQGLSYGESLIYQVQNPLSLGTTDTIARLVGGYLASMSPSQSELDKARNAAAVHWAIWEVTTESLKPYSLADGNVRITSSLNQDTIDLANQYLADVSTFTPANVTFLTNGTRQDVVTWSVVPEPASAGLLALSGLLLFRRRR